MNTDPISDLLTRIRNAQNANHTELSAPYSKIKENILKVMKKSGFIKDYSVEKDKFTKLNISLNDDQTLTLKRVSSPGQRIYKKKSELKLIKSGLGISILSTSKGIMNNVEARKQNLGGEILCEIY